MGYGGGITVEAAPARVTLWHMYDDYGHATSDMSLIRDDFNQAANKSKHPQKTYREQNGITKARNILPFFFSTYSEVATKSDRKHQLPKEVPALASHSASSIDLVGIVHIQKGGIRSRRKGKTETRKHSKGYQFMQKQTYHKLDMPSCEYLS